jgi:hypothetical protein
MRDGRQARFSFLTASTKKPLLMTVRGCPSVPGESQSQSQSQSRGQSQGRGRGQAAQGSHVFFAKKKSFS